MNTASHAHMLEALKQRKGQGINLTIVLGGPKGAEVHEDPSQDDMDMTDDHEDDAERKELGDAPDATHIGVDDTDKPHASLLGEIEKEDDQGGAGELPEQPVGKGKDLVGDELSKMGPGTLMGKHMLRSKGKSPFGK